MTQPRQKHGQKNAGITDPAPSDTPDTSASSTHDALDEEDDHKAYVPYSFAGDYPDLVPWTDTCTTCSTCSQELPIAGIHTLSASLLDLEKSAYPWYYRAHRCYHAAELDDNGVPECGYAPCGRGDLIYIHDEKPTSGNPSNSCAGYLFGYNTVNGRLGWFPVDVLTAESQQRGRVRR
eukprot:GEMP01007993.1.p1 GENE.GEMP01007993.1~~GEMP01007993.1.p1  ORF type:complete len:178 (+),score=37.68 GEMP01007993.1:97-630(+)